MATPAISLTFRGLTVQDLMQVSNFSQTTTTVLGVGSGVLVTGFVAAASDAAAAAAAVPVGASYINTGGAFPYLATRMT
jgi:hypothetical protein